MGKEVKELQYSFIYCLKDPFTKDIKYIGQTTDFEMRFNSHCYDKSGQDKSVWIKSLAEQGKLPIIEIIEKCPTFFASAREAFYIVEEIKKGTNLFNKTYRNELMTSMYHFEFRLDLRGLLRTEQRNTGIFEPFLLNNVIEYYYENKYGYKKGDDLNRFINIGTDAK